MASFVKTMLPSLIAFYKPNPPRFAGATKACSMEKKLVKIKAGVYRYYGKKAVFNIQKYKTKWVVEDARNPSDNWTEPALKKAIFNIKNQGF